MLFTYSVLFIVVMIALVLLPYLRSRGELVTFNNLFYVGSAIFIGLSGINAVQVGHYFPYDGYTYARFFLSTTLFYISYHIAYRESRKAYISGMKWGSGMPVWTPSGLMWFFLCLLPLILLPAVAPNIPGLGRILVQLGFVVPGFIVAAALWVAIARKYNPVVVFLSISAILLCLIVLLSAGGGRRALYGAMFGLPIGFYWLVMRRWRRRNVLLFFLMILIVGIIFDQAYNRVRWIGTTRSSQEIDGADERLRLITDNLSIESLNRVARMGQTGVEYSLMSIHFYSGADSPLKIEPLHSLYILATFPIPRAFWPGKPRHLGLTLPFDARIFKDGTKTNAGPGIAGHVANDGGMLLAIPYGILLALALRYLDGIINSRKNDPLVLGFMASSGFHILGWSRGDISSFTIWPVLCFVFLLFMKWFVVAVGLARRPIPEPIGNGGSTESIANVRAGMVRRGGNSRRWVNIVGNNE